MLYNEHCSDPVVARLQKTRVHCQPSHILFAKGADSLPDEEAVLVLLAVVEAMEDGSRVISSGLPRGELDILAVCVPVSEGHRNPGFAPGLLDQRFQFSHLRCPM